MCNNKIKKMKSAIYFFAICSCIILQRTELSGQKSPFAPGEELVYTISYGIIKGGEGKLTVKDTLIDKQRTLHLTAAGHTTGLVDAIYKVRDQYESFVNPETVKPIKSIRDIREGRYRYYNEVLYYHGVDSTFIKSQKSGEKYVPADIYDIVSAFYVGRKKYFNDSMVEGQVIEIKTYFSDEVFPLRIRYLGIETIKTNLGKLECYKFSPVTEVGRAFKSEDDMHVWITRDENKLPAKIRFNLFVGAFICEIDSANGLKHPYSKGK